MFSPRLPSRALALLVGLAAGGCEVIADFDREKINPSMVTTGDLPMIPVVPPEKPQPVDDGGAEDAGADAGADASVDLDAGDMDSGTSEDPLDASAEGGDASEPDASADGGDASADSGP